MRGDIIAASHGKLISSLPAELRAFDWADLRAIVCPHFNPLHKSANRRNFCSGSGRVISIFRSSFAIGLVRLGRPLFSAVNATALRR